jgi:hypothetical protein
MTFISAPGVWTVHLNHKKPMHGMTGTDNSPILGSFLAFYQQK